MALRKINELGIELNQYEEKELIQIENEKWNNQQPLIELKEVIHEYESGEEKFSLGALNIKIYSQLFLLTSISSKT